MIPLKFLEHTIILLITYNLIFSPSLHVLIYWTSRIRCIAITDMSMAKIREIIITKGDSRVGNELKDEMMKAKIKR